MKFSAKNLRPLIGHDRRGDEVDPDLKLISDTYCDHRRWSVGSEIIFEYHGKFYKSRYYVGATESQEEHPWEYEDEVECPEVRPIEKLVTVYEEV